MKTIWKFPIQVDDEQSMLAPDGWRPLAVQFQRGELCLWALVDPEAEKKKVRVYVNGTGHPVRHNGTFVGTVQMMGGDLVFHVFVDPGDVS